jgi:hypothetical protein
MGSGFALGAFVFFHNAPSLPKLVYHFKQKLLFYQPILIRYRHSINNFKIIF